MNRVGLLFSFYIQNNATGRPNEIDLMTSSINNADIWTISKKHHFDNWTPYILKREEN